MTALVIIAFILLLFAAVLLLNCRLFISYRQDFVMYASVLFLRIPIVPGKKKKIRKKMKPSQITKEFAKQKARERLKAEKKAAKKIRAAKKPKLITDFSDARELLAFIKDILSELFSRLDRKVRVDVRSFRIKLGSTSPCTAALEYSAAKAAYEMFFDFLRRNTLLELSECRGRGILPDFTEEGFSADISLVVSMRVYDILAAVLPPGIKVFSFLKRKKQI